MTFTELGIEDTILKALDDQGYQNPTPIQSQAIPILLEKHDLLGCAQTGTGKTAAFTLPIIQHLIHEGEIKGKRKTRSLILTPTRELALQIEENIKAYAKYTNVRSTVIFGGVKQHQQTNALSKGVDILVATPGRLLDLINQRFINLKDIEYFVLDEADQMLDMGFIHDINKIIKLLPQKRQSMFFSATMSPQIVSLSKKILGEPRSVTIAPKKKTADKVEQLLYRVSKKDKTKLLPQLLQDYGNDTCLVFSRTKHGADKIVRVLEKSNIKSAAIHGNKSQNARQKVLKQFKDGSLRVLIATDIAARGIDVDELGLVVNYDLPNVPETYVHRIGRTGRANAAGTAISFCDAEEKALLRDIEKLVGFKITEVKDHEFLTNADARPEKPAQTEQRRRNFGGRNKSKSSQGQRKGFGSKPKKK